MGKILMTKLPQMGYTLSEVWVRVSIVHRLNCGRTAISLDRTKRKAC